MQKRVKFINSIKKLKNVPVAFCKRVTKSDVITVPKELNGRLKGRLVMVIELEDTL